LLVNTTENSWSTHVIFRTLEITAKMLGEGKVITADTQAKRLIWVQARLLEAMCSDPELTDRQRVVLMALHSKALRDLIAERRGARR